MAIELRLKNGDNILWYRPKNIWDQTKDCMILVPWLPHYLDKYHPFIKTCADANIDLFVIRYTGSRENKGEFNLSNNIVDIDKTIDFVEQWRAISLYDKKEIKFNYKKIYLLWFSYWALPLIFSQSKDNLTKILVCPFVNYLYHKRGSSGEIIEDTLNFVNDAYGNVYNIKKEELINDFERINYEDSDKKSKYKLVIWKKDTSISLDEINWLRDNFDIDKIIEQDSGHSLNISVENLLSLL